MITDFPRLLAVLTEAQVEFILIGGVAGIAHGAARLTLDLDVVYRRSHENLVRLARALAPYTPYLRGAPPDLPFLWDAETLRRGLNFTLTTALGDIDLLGEITGGGTYDEIVDHCVVIQALGIECLCLDLGHLIYVKRAAGRPKDLEAIAELEAILEERGETAL